MATSGGGTETVAMGCALCERLEHSELRGSTDTVAAFDDGFPSTPGHTLVVPKRHVARLTELTEQEHRELWQECLRQQHRLAALAPDGFTVGVNDGEAAGQTIAHVHLHVIPRHHGDTQRARGGVRWAVSETAQYWA